MIGEKFAQVQAAVAAATERRRTAHGDAEPVLLVAVTKNHAVDEIRQAIDAGATVAGENRVQEALGKIDAVERKISWHLIGHLQTNKVNQAAAIFDLIHSVDSERLLTALDKAAEKIGKRQDILLQVNLAREESKFGLTEEELPAMLKKADELPHVHTVGLMCIAPNYADPEEARPLFRQMYALYSDVKKMALAASDIKYLSMGMTNDYVVAIEEGANIVRVGTAIFGPRRY